MKRLKKTKEGIIGTNRSEKSGVVTKTYVFKPSKKQNPETDVPLVNIKNGGIITP